MKSEWVSVQERMPEEGQMVLVYIGLNPNWMSSITQAKLLQYEADIYRTGTFLRFPTDVTHWMPLPDPPGAGND